MNQEEHDKLFIKKKTLYIQQLNNDVGLAILRHIYEMTGYGTFHDDQNMSNDQIRGAMAKGNVWAELRKYISDDMRSQVENYLEPKAQRIEKDTLPEKTLHPYLRNKERNQ